MSEQRIIRLGEGHDAEYEAFVGSTVEWIEAACRADGKRGLFALVSILSTMANTFPEPAEFLTIVANCALDNIMKARAKMHPPTGGKSS